MNATFTSALMFGIAAALSATMGCAMSGSTEPQVLAGTLDLASFDQPISAISLSRGADIIATTTVASDGRFQFDVDGTEDLTLSVGSIAMNVVVDDNDGVESLDVGTVAFQPACSFASQSVATRGAPTTSCALVAHPKVVSIAKSTCTDGTNPLYSPSCSGGSK